MIQFSKHSSPSPRDSWRRKTLNSRRRRSPNNSNELQQASPQRLPTIHSRPLRRRVIPRDRITRPNNSNSRKASQVESNYPLGTINPRVTKLKRKKLTSDAAQFDSQGARERVCEGWRPALLHLQVSSVCVTTCCIYLTPPSSELCAILFIKSIHSSLLPPPLHSNFIKILED